MFVKKDTLKTALYNSYCFTRKKSRNRSAGSAGKAVFANKTQNPISYKLICFSAISFLMLMSA